MHHTLVTVLSGSLHMYDTGTWQDLKGECPHHASPRLLFKGGTNSEATPSLSTLQGDGSLQVIPEIKPRVSITRGWRVYKRSSSIFPQ